MTREELLNKAKEMVCGHREKEYGTPEDNFNRIASFWTAYKGVDFTANDVAMMMSLLKIARIQSGNATEDSFVDLAGYAACGAEIMFHADSLCKEYIHCRDCTYNKKDSNTCYLGLELDNIKLPCSQFKIKNCSSCQYLGDECSRSHPECSDQHSSFRLRNAKELDKQKVKNSDLRDNDDQCLDDH